ncbi:MAG: FkbM family methyltransferase [Terracidiphilus sp.]
MFDTLPNSQQDFYTTVLTAAIHSLKINTYLDNYDALRFNLDGKDHSMEFDSNARAFYFDWFFKHHPGLFDAYQQLADDSSRRLYLYLIAFRLAGHHSIRLPLSFAARKAEWEEFCAFEARSSEESLLPLSGMFGKLRHYDFEYEGSRYIVDCLKLEYYLFRRQYFYSDNGINIAPEPGDAVIDGGACLGDTALVFSNAVGPKGKVYSFDPVAEHLEVLRHNISQFPHKNVQAMPYGLSDKNESHPPLVLNQYAPGFKAKDQQVPLRSIDNLVMFGEIDRINFIKLDIEGAEYEALKGARESINRFKPKLAISLYHKPNDIYELIRYVRNEHPFYRLHLGHYTVHQEETVLYCAA